MLAHGPDYNAVPSRNNCQQNSCHRTYVVFLALSIKNVKAETCYLNISVFWQG